MNMSCAFAEWNRIGDTYKRFFDRVSFKRELKIVAGWSMMWPGVYGCFEELWKEDLQACASSICKLKRAGAKTCFEAGRDMGV